jgi:saccharopine dehydrogenase-like NADP-dependent oxidoreductase
MSKKFQIVIAGAGGMGSAVGLLLRELGDFKVDLLIGDSNRERARAAAAWIREGSTRPGEVHFFDLPASGSSPAFEAVLERGDILLDCLPGEEAPRMARCARQHDLHYANLTEHVRETDEILAIAEGAEKGFVLQTGIAPGYVNVLAHGLFQRFCREHEVHSVERVLMRVGALTTTASAPCFYGFTWSTIGVATEYVEPAIVVRDGERTTRPSLSEVEPLTIDGVTYEEALTSGGAADLPLALAGRVRHLDYKTLRYPGHYAWVRGLLAERPDSVDAAEYLHERMMREVPFLDDDLIVLYAAVEGFDAGGTLRRLVEARQILPCQVGARRLKAIQATTTAGLAEAARLLLLSNLRGVVLQSQIDAARFMAGPFVDAVYHR